MNQDFALSVYSKDMRIPYLEDNSYIYGEAFLSRHSLTRKEYPIGSQGEPSLSLHEEPLLTDDILDPPHKPFLESTREEREFLIQNDIERQLQEREEL